MLVSDIIMFYIYLFHFGVTLFVFYPKTVVLLKVSQDFQENTCTGVSFLTAVNNYFNEESPIKCFPKPLIVFAKHSIVDVRLDSKYASVLHSC